MKKNISAILPFAVIFAISVSFTGCFDSSVPETNYPANLSERKVSIKVTTTYGGDDGGRAPYEQACRDWEKKTGNKIIDASGISNEAFKSKILSDFAAGAEADVLFYFSGRDADTLVSAGKVVSIPEIRKTYPDYASNHDMELIPASPADNTKYAVPNYGYWELLYVNTTVLNDCGIAVPNENTTWDEFLKICSAVRGKAYIPIAASIHEIPHYWFEYTIMNNIISDATDGDPKNPLAIPEKADDAAGRAWVRGLTDIKYLYQMGFFPDNTTTASDSETFSLLLDDRAAFAIDGSWKLGSIAESEHGEKITVTFVPGKNERENTEIVTGLSSGWYITRKCWDDPEKQAAAIDFISHMTSDEVILSFDAFGVPLSLKDRFSVPEDLPPLRKQALRILEKVTTEFPSLSDMLSLEQRETLFSDIKRIAMGLTTAEEAVNKAFSAGKRGGN